MTGSCRNMRGMDDDALKLGLNWSDEPLEGVPMGPSLNMGLEREPRLNKRTEFELAAARWLELFGD